MVGRVSFKKTKRPKEMLRLCFIWELLATIKHSPDVAYHMDGHAKTTFHLSHESNIVTFVVHGQQFHGDDTASWDGERGKEHDNKQKQSTTIVSYFLWEKITVCIKINLRLIAEESRTTSCHWIFQNG